MCAAYTYDIRHTERKRDGLADYSGNVSGPPFQCLTLVPVGHTLQWACDRRHLQPRELLRAALSLPGLAPRPGEQLRRLRLPGYYQAHLVFMQDSTDCRTHMFFLSLLRHQRIDRLSSHMKTKKAILQSRLLCLPRNSRNV